MAKKTAKVRTKTPSARRVSNPQAKSVTPPSNPQARTRSSENPQARTRRVVNPQLRSLDPIANPVPSANVGPVGGMLSAQQGQNPSLSANVGGVVPQIGANSGMPNNINNQQGLATGAGQPQPVVQPAPAVLPVTQPKSPVIPGTTTDPQPTARTGGEQKTVIEGAPIDVEAEAPVKKKRKTSKVRSTRSGMTQEASTPNFNFFFGQQ